MTDPPRTALVFAGLCVLVPWGMTEWLLPPRYDILSVRLGFIVGVAASPALYWIYRRSLRGTTTHALMGILYSFLWKGSILAGSTLLLWVLLDITVILYALPLFFSLFSLGFFAIYLAWTSVSNSPKDRPHHDSYA